MDQSVSLFFIKFYRDSGPSYYVSYVCLVHPGLSIRTILTSVVSRKERHPVMWFTRSRDGSMVISPLLLGDLGTSEQRVVPEFILTVLSEGERLNQGYEHIRLIPFLC